MINIQLSLFSYDTRLKLFGEKKDENKTKQNNQ